MKTYMRSVDDCLAKAMLTTKLRMLRFAARLVHLRLAGGKVISHQQRCAALRLLTILRRYEDLLREGFK